jgi:hypothetical protein
MARITSQLSRDRDQFAYELFLQKDEPGKPINSPKDVNTKLVERDGFRMGAVRLYQLRDAAVAGEPIPAKASCARTPEQKLEAKASRAAAKAAAVVEAAREGASVNKLVE